MGIIVTVDDKHIKNIKAIANSLSVLGLQIDNIMSMTGIISGSLKSEIKPEKLKIKGVKSVEISKKLSAF